MRYHVNFCEKKSQKKSVATSQSILTLTSTDGIFKHLRDVAKLVYRNNIPISQIVRSATLQMFYRRLGINGVTIDSVTNCLEEEYHSVVSGIEQLVHSRARKELCLSFDKWTSAAISASFVCIHLPVVKPDVHERNVSSARNKPLFQ